MLEPFLKKRKIAFFLINLALFVLPILFFYKESEIIVAPAILFFALSALYCASRNQLFQAMLFFAFLSSMEPIIRVFAPSLRYSFLNYLIVAIGAIVFFINRKRANLEREHVVYAAYLLIAIASLSYTTGIDNGAWWVLNLATTLIVLLIFTTIKIDLEIVKQLATAFLFGVINLAIVLSYYFIKNHSERLGSLAGTGPNETGYLLGVSIIICICWMLSEKERKKRILSVIGTISISTVAFFTLTRGTIIAIVLSSLVRATLEKKIKIIAAIVIISLFGLITVNYTTGNYFANQIMKGNFLTNRDASFFLAIQLFYSSPIIGKGIGSFQDESMKYMGVISTKARESASSFTHTHNELTQQLAELGVIGALPWLVFFILIARESIKEKTKTTLFLYLLFLMMFQGLLLSYSKIILALLIAKGWNKENKSEKNEKNSNSS